MYGYARLHMRQVAKLAGVSPGTVYTYFPSKEVLYSALYAQRLDAFADELAALRAASATHEDLFVNVAVAYADVHRGFAAAQDIWRLSGDAAAFDSEHTARLATAARRVVDEIDRVAGRLRPEPTPEADEPFGALLWSVLLGLAQQHTGTPSPEWERLARFATRTLRVGWQSPSATTTSADKENQHR